MASRIRKISGTYVLYCVFMYVIFYIVIKTGIKSVKISDLVCEFA